MTVKRYTPESDPQDGPCSIWMEESVEGHYVTYSDYQKLVAENAALKDINAWCRTDAFKNMYREFKIAEAAGCDTTDCMHDAMLTAIMHAPATPATYAAIAETKAQGVDEFADHMQSEKPFCEPEDWAMMDLAAEEAYKFAANLRAGRTCGIPPAGWSCTRASGHDGPCAAIEDASHE